MWTKGLLYGLWVWMDRSDTARDLIYRHVCKDHSAEHNKQIYGAIPLPSTPRFLQLMFLLHQFIFTTMSLQHRCRYVLATSLTSRHIIHDHSSLTAHIDHSTTFTWGVIYTLSFYIKIVHIFRSTNVHTIFVAPFGGMGCPLPRGGGGTTRSPGLVFVACL